MSNKALAAELQATLEEFRTRAIQAAWVGNVDGLTVEDNGNGVERVVKRRKVTIDQSEARQSSPTIDETRDPPDKRGPGKGSGRRRGYQRGRAARRGNVRKNRPVHTIWI